MCLTAPFAFLLGIVPPPAWPSTPPPSPARNQADEKSAATGEPENALEFALSDESFQLAFEHATGARSGAFTFGVLGNEDEDLAFDAQFLRTGSVAGSPFRFGVGLGAYAVFVDRPDADTWALALSGSAGYGFDLGLPAEVRVAASYAPDVTTFDDGDGLFDGRVRLQVDLSDFAAAFVGYRFLEVQLDGRSDAEIEDRLHLGIRMSL